jgi:membrane protease YdiL (CAAX protease family)
LRSTIWCPLAFAALLAAGLLLLLAPDAPQPRLGPPAAAAVGGAAGLLLYCAVARRRPYGPPPTPPVVAACAVLIVAAASEEILWRRVVLGELLRAGPFAAVAGSTLGFALAHRGRPALHLGTGAAFGCLYLATGALIASIAAHWSYNVLLLTLTRRGRASEGPK